MREGHLNLAKAQRSEATDAERLLWNRVRARKLAGFKFRRQVPLGPYIVDYVCHEAGLIVELDGSQHARQRDLDAKRTEQLIKLGYRVLRFSNGDVLKRTDDVLRTIFGALEVRVSQKTPPLQRRERSGRSPG